MPDIVRRVLKALWIASFVVLLAIVAGAFWAQSRIRASLPALDGMQQLFHAEYLSPGWQAGHVPDDV